MSEPTGELSGESDPEPPPSSEKIDYEKVLRAKLDLIPADVANAKIKLARHACLYLFTTTEGEELAPVYGARAAVSDELAQTYRNLQSDQRHELEARTINGMNEYVVADEQTSRYYVKRTQAMMNYQPLLFEPYEHAVLQGEWRGHQKRRLVFESELVSKPEQRAILLGGLATVISFLHQNR